ncbi:redox-sensing transcriptional repressor Rex [Anaerocolumna aminovalerica]|uniref:Redox-sensing transcriptional repressor Rex n=1 Tax=Anaerocolumna aminovalerica TaxID=1527 RepID=A0A1I5DAY5_9FIRM|nr:redox-sensing transcriptional repressor Rex [Anaerocolumna aminovalerica]MBU5334450.1 redox-sensing transcriptional repressor Rex [Anaerocolumna aminovalerica]SFN96409.1 redox-sensing transcriptional repressor [Anaerocolumna aminovalerica]
MDDDRKYGVTIQALRRVPYYLQQLKILQKNNVETVSAPKIAELLYLNEVQVRKDFASVSLSKGKPKAGFSVSELITNMEKLLGYDNTEEAVLVGAGSLAHALLAYEELKTYGIKIVAAFDNNAAYIGMEINGTKVLPAEKVSDLCRRMKVHIGIITVPAAQAQIVCDQLVAGGVLAIWNFAPVHLSVPDHILVQNENLAASLAVLSKHLKKTIDKI